MELCPRCSTFVEALWGYCPTCSRPRILESLRLGTVSRPHWQHWAWRGLVVLFLLWLAVTLPVAAFREAKAVRDSRELLAQGNAQEAWWRLQPYLPEHPEHRQALFLCGKATIRLSQWTEAKQCLDGVSQQSPELAAELRQDYGQILTEQSRSLGCNPEAFKQVLTSAQGLGDNFVENVVSGLDGVVEACRASGSDRALPLIREILDEKGRASEMVPEGYVPAIQRAVAQARYLDVEALVYAAIVTDPDSKAALDAALTNERKKVADTAATLQRLQDEVKDDPRHRANGAWCFPAAIPAAVQPARDGWGRPVQYSPVGPDRSGLCHKGFTLTSLGGDGAPTESDWRQSPAAEIVCRFVAGSESWQRPSRFWWPPA